MKELKQLLCDINITPTAKIIEDGLGSTNKVYIKFIDELKKYDISLMEWRYYNDGKTWPSKGEYKWTTAKGTSKIKPIFWLSIWEGFFKVSFLFSEKVKDQLLNLPVSEETREFIRNIKPNGDKIRFLSIVFDVDNDKQLNDVFALAQFRKENI